MGFKRTGSPERIDMIADYNQANEKVVLCPDCSSVLGYESGDLVKVGSSVLLNSTKLTCLKCESERA